ncbi:MAG: phosphosulfolactate synthase [Bacteroidia bacterium]|nr:phosphosulfolactate synthase [Bacteroidia bacterium]MCO5254919.1 phosphosulfolactate synthase [Bacteroidota bacterium]MCZ2128726.1 phosphosulfolactate synthase [Bacteroidia bacterium]
MNNQSLFHLINIPERTAKPRTNGLTMVMDKGASLNEAQSLAENGEHIIDLIKLGFGTAYITPRLKEKIALYQQAGFKVYLGGTLFEAYLIRGQFDDYCRLLDNLKLDTVEVSDGSILISHEEKCKHIETLSKQFTVLSEVGSKDAEKIIPHHEWIAMMKTELEAGAWKVIAEARESGTVGIFKEKGEVRTDLIDQIVNTIPEAQILWEAPLKSQQVWFIKLFGQNVNLGNINPHDIIALEALRLGLRGDSFNFFL